MREFLVGESFNPYETLFWEAIGHAIKSDASDIHIQPEAEGVEIRFRIFGELTTWKLLAEMHREVFLQEAKRLCKCSLSISGRAQDARIRAGHLSVDIRVSLVPTLHGEKLVLRLLRQNRSFDLTAFGLTRDSESALKRSLENRSGVCLFTGPTGSGKTTLLYSVLHSLDRKKLNIVTIEDPVEYTFPGINQIQVTSKLSFADSLRAVLRQDPDVVLVGEVRDAETANLCFQAASTGHLVLSTLHANSAIEVPDRLDTLGVSPHLRTNCLRFTSAQRLIQRLCSSCARELGEEEIKRGLAVIGDRKHLRKRNSEGCKDCREGVRGRIPVLEYVDWTRTKELSGKPYQSKTLNEEALDLAKKGEVDVCDALHVA